MHRKLSMTVAVVAALVSGGCGSLSVDELVGTWTGDETFTTTCPGFDPATSTGHTSFKMAKTGSTQLTASPTPTGDCVVALTFDGERATMGTVSVGCTASTTTGMAPFTLSSYSLAITDAQHATLTATGVLANPGEDCPVSISGSFTKP